MEVISWAKPPSDEDARAARQADAWLTPVWPFRQGTVSKKWPPEAPEKAEKSRPRAPKIPTQSTQNFRRFGQENKLIFMLFVRVLFCY